MIHRIQLAPLVIALGLACGSAHATLIGRDLNGSAGSFEAYYDTDLNITWLANANVNDLMNWADANTWASNLSFTNGVSVYDHWRLPATLQPDASCGSQTMDGSSFGYGCTGSELGHLFYSELGGTALQSILTSGDADLAKFTNLQATPYWSGTEMASSPDAAWAFSFGDGCDGSGGFQRGKNKDARCGSALAVRSGDITAVPEQNGVPEPQTLALVGLGFLGLAAARRRV